MQNAQILKEAKETIIRYLPRGYKVLLFGSWATGKALKTSDIDIGILGGSVVPLETFAKIREGIEAIPTLRKIDVVDLKRVEKRFRDEALKIAKKL